MQYFAGILILLFIYGIIIRRAKTGRCFRFEYIVKTLMIIGLYILCYSVIFIHFNFFSIKALISIFFIALPILTYKSLKYTIQRFYDLGLSGWYILLKLIPVFSILITIFLYFKKGKKEINEYDEAINYKKMLKEKHFIDIYENIFFIDNFEYQYELYLEKYLIKIPNSEDNNFFTDYLLEKYAVKKTQYYKIVEIAKEELNCIIENLNLIILNESFYINIKQFKIFIRKEDFKFTLILDKKQNAISKELIETFDFPGSFLEDENYIYYDRIDKEKLLLWVKNVV